MVLYVLLSHEMYLFIYIWDYIWAAAKSSSQPRNPGVSIYIYMYTYLLKSFIVETHILEFCHFPSLHHSAFHRESCPRWPEPIQCSDLPVFGPMGKSTKKEDMKPVKGVKKGKVKNESHKKKEQDTQKVSKPVKPSKVAKKEHGKKTTDKKDRDMKGSEKRAKGSSSDKVTKNHKKTPEPVPKKDKKSSKKTPEASQVGTAAKPSIMKKQSNQPPAEPPTRRISFKQPAETSPSTPPDKVRRLSSPTLSVSSEDSLAKLKMEAKEKNMEFADYLQHLSREQLDKEVEAHMTCLVAEQGGEKDEEKEGEESDGDESDPGEDEAASDPPDSESSEENDKGSDSDMPDQLDEPGSEEEDTGSEDSSDTGSSDNEDIEDQVNALVPYADQAKKDTSQAAANQADSKIDTEKQQQQPTTTPQGNEAALQVAVQEQRLVGEKQVPVKEANSS